jgi:hypothetical protein
VITGQIQQKDFSGGRGSFVCCSGCDAVGCCVVVIVIVSFVLAIGMIFVGDFIEGAVGC